MILSERTFVAAHIYLNYTIIHFIYIISLRLGLGFVCLADGYDNFYEILFSHSGHSHCDWDTRQQQLSLESTSTPRYNTCI